MSSKILVVGHRNPDNDSIAAAVGYAHLKNALAARDGEADAVETPIGYEPKPEDINIEGLKDITLDTIKGLLDVDVDLWKADTASIEEFYAKFGSKLPAEMKHQLEALKARLG